MANNTRKNNMRKNNTRRNNRKNNTMSGGASKRKMSPYMRWANKERKSVMTAMPNARVPDIGRELGRRWRALSPKEKARA
jgi:hypothetical protein